MRPFPPIRLTGGFTLVELSIVLVIIGLIIGGVLAGRDLISAAGVRAQISQIQKYNAAANTFRSKYGYLPGDIPDPYATNFGFQARGQYEGQGDGNGVIEGVNNNSPNQHLAAMQGAGESAVFWQDMAVAGLIEGSFTLASTTNPISGIITGPSIGQYFPAAKIGRGNYIYVYGGGILGNTNYFNNGIQGTGDGKNYLCISTVSQLASSGLTVSPTVPVTSMGVQNNPGLTVAEAYNIDKKIDDGLPQSGNVLAVYNVYWAFSSLTGASNGGYLNPYSYAVGGSQYTCFDNNSSGAAMQYSMGQNSGAGINCALSFVMQ